MITFIEPGDEIKVVEMIVKVEKMLGEDGSLSNRCHQPKGGEASSKMEGLVIESGVRCVRFVIIDNHQHSLWRLTDTHVAVVVGVDNGSIKQPVR